MSIDKILRTYRAQPGLAALAKSRPIPLANHLSMKHVRDKDIPFLYRVEVTTRNRRTQEIIKRLISVSDEKQVSPNDILRDGTDAIMESPIAAREEAISARLISAHRFKP